MPHLGSKSTFTIKLAFLAKEMAQINRQYEGFLDQVNGLKGWKPICHSQAKWYHYDCS